MKGANRMQWNIRKEKGSMELIFVDGELWLCDLNEEGLAEIERVILPKWLSPFIQSLQEVKGLLEEIRKGEDIHAVLNKGCLWEINQMPDKECCIILILDADPDGVIMLTVYDCYDHSDEYWPESEETLLATETKETYIPYESLDMLISALSEAQAMM